LPAVALLKEILETEGRLLFHYGVDPFDWIAVLVVSHAHAPVLADGALETDVKAEVAFDCGVDHPVRALNSSLAAVELTKGPAEFELIVGNSDRVYKIE